MEKGEVWVNFWYPNGATVHYELKKISQLLTAMEGLRREQYSEQETITFKVTPAYDGDGKLNILNVSLPKHKTRKE